MPKVWNIGNTTVRNPKRIEKALKVFYEEGFSGNAKGPEREVRLHSKLKEKEVVDPEGTESDWNGRKWRAAFYQLGFISYEKYSIEGVKYNSREFFQKIGISSIESPFQLTPSGLKLISATMVPEIEEVYTRQFACYEIPNSLESGFPEGKMKPFILFLEILNKLQNNNLLGLNKFETGLFIQKFRNHTPNLLNEIYDEIIEYRKRIGDCNGSQEIKQVRNLYLDELAKFSEIDPLSVVRDYADTTFRYFSLSGLFTRIGDSIIIRDNKREFVNELLQSEPVFWNNSKPYDYFNFFYTNSYLIPTDDINIALSEISFLKKGISRKDHHLLLEANKLTPESEISLVQKIRYNLIEYNNWEREQDFANVQREKESINEIISYLKALNNEPISQKLEIDDRPAFLEWAVWRSFLAINDIIIPIHETRRFPIDQDFMPRNVAPGGGSDLLFEFENYVLIVEVTLTISNRQMAVESEPVRRHTVQYKERYPNKDVYCLFIAPSLDNNIVETFRIGVWYNADEEEFVNIIPMSLTDFIYLIEVLITKRFNNSDFKNLLDRCLIFRNVRAPQWKKTIQSEVLQWKRKFLN